MYSIKSGHIGLAEPERGGLFYDYLSARALLYVRSFKNRLEKRCARDSTMLLVKTAITTLGE